MLAVKGLLNDKFKFLKRLNNNCGYLFNKARNQLIIRRQISECVNWNRENLLDIFFNIYKLKIELVDVTHTHLEINYLTEIRQEPIELNIRVYRSKVISCISDRSFQSLINARAQKCPSIRQCKYWKKILNSEFKVKSNTMGCYVNSSEKIAYYLRHYKDTISIRNNNINIRLAVDGTQVGSNSSVLNLVF